MNIARIRQTCALGTLISIVASSIQSGHGQNFTDPGFENYAVSAGGFARPASGAWLFGNDAGVVEPPAPNSSTGSLNTWSATFAAMDGQQYASTYAGTDTLRQSVSFSTPGDYRISVYAAAPIGAVTIPAVGTLTLGSGEFGFTLASVVIGSLHTVSAGSGWSLFAADFAIGKPGDYQLGIRNTAASPYFINYDAFAIQPVPEPSTFALGLVGGLAVAIRGHRRKNRSSDVKAG